MPLRCLELAQFIAESEGRSTFADGRYQAARDLLEAFGCPYATGHQHAAACWRGALAHASGQEWVEAQPARALQLFVRSCAVSAGGELPVLPDGSRVDGCRRVAELLTGAAPGWTVPDPARAADFYRLSCTPDRAASCPKDQGIAVGPAASAPR